MNSWFDSVMGFHFVFLPKIYTKGEVEFFKFVIELTNLLEYLRKLIEILREKIQIQNSRSLTNLKNGDISKQLERLKLNQFSKFYVSLP